MRAIPLEQAQHDAIASRYVRLCVDHVIELDEGSLACPQPHQPYDPPHWFLWDRQTQRVVGGICTLEDGDTGGFVDEEKAEKARAIGRPAVSRRNTTLHDVTQEGLMKKGEKLTEEQKADIVRNHEPETPHGDQAKKYRIAQSTYSRIIRESRGGAEAPRKGGRKKAAAKAKPASVPVTVPGLDLRGVLAAELERLRKETTKVESILEALED